MASRKKVVADSVKMDLSISDAVFFLGESI